MAILRRRVSLELFVKPESTPAKPTILTFDDILEVAFIESRLCDITIADGASPTEMRAELQPSIDALNKDFDPDHSEYRLGEFDSAKEEYIESSGRPPLWKYDKTKTYSFRVYKKNKQSGSYQPLSANYADGSHSLAVNVWISVELMPSQP